MARIETKMNEGLPVHNSTVDYILECADERLLSQLVVSSFRCFLFAGLENRVEGFSLGFSSDKTYVLLITILTK